MPLATTDTPTRLDYLDLVTSVEIAAPRPEVFHALTAGVGCWWGLPYGYDAEPGSDIVIEPRLGGHFKQLYPSGEGMIFSTVTGIHTPDYLKLDGWVSIPTAMSFIEIALEEIAAGTRVVVHHRIIGQVTDEMEQGYTAGWTDLIGTRLKAYVERGEKLGIRQ